MKWILVFCCALFLGGCSQQPPPKIVAQVNNYTITQEEFDEAYKDSSYNPSIPGQSRRDFLNHMVDQKLILLDAEAHGLDRDKEFLKMVENFWQQSLLTQALKEKNKEGVDLDQWVKNLRDNSKVEINEGYVQ